MPFIGDSTRMDTNSDLVYHGTGFIGIQADSPYVLFTKDQEVLVYQPTFYPDGRTLAQWKAAWAEKGYEMYFFMVGDVYKKLVYISFEGLGAVAVHPKHFDFVKYLREKKKDQEH